jgi:hypothetical protein
MVDDLTDDGLPRRDIVLLAPPPGAYERVARRAHRRRVRRSVLVGSAAAAVLALSAGTAVALSGSSAPDTLQPAGPTAAPRISKAPETSAAAGRSATPSPPAVALSPTSEPEAGVPADRQDVGYLHSIQVVNGATYLTFDRIVLLQGDEARAAARAAGRRQEEVDTTDFWVVNDNLQLRTVRLAPEVDVEAGLFMAGFLEPDWAMRPKGHQFDFHRPLSDLQAYVAQTGPQLARSTGGISPFELVYGEDGAVTAVTERWIES